jgi:hypothetical protein
LTNQREIPETPAVEVDLAQAVQDVIEQQLLDVHTLIPGRILEYEGHETRKARVEISVNLPTGNGELITPPPIDNVPVIFPSVSTSSILLPVKKGDGCLLLFSEAGIGNFLLADKTVDADDYSRFDTTDCIAIPGLHSNLTLPETDLAINNEDLIIYHKDNLLKMSDDDITIEKGETTIVVDKDGNVNITSKGDTSVTADGNVTVDGTAIELNGNTKPFVTHAELDVALQTMVGLINTHTHLYAPGPLPPVPTAPPLPLTTVNIASAATTTVKTGG